MPEIIFFRKQSHRLAHLHRSLKSNNGKNHGITLQLIDDLEKLGRLFATQNEYLIQDMQRSITTGSLFWFDMQRHMFLRSGQNVVGETFADTSCETSHVVAGVAKDIPSSGNRRFVKMRSLRTLNDLDGSSKDNLKSTNPTKSSSS
jgi:hypothetical protein